MKTSSEVSEIAKALHEKLLDKTIDLEILTRSVIQLTLIMEEQAQIMEVVAKLTASINKRLAVTAKQPGIVIANRFPGDGK